MYKLIYKLIYKPLHTSECKRGFTKSTLTRKKFITEVFVKLIINNFLINV